VIEVIKAASACGALVANYVNERESLVKKMSAAENDLRLSEAQIQRRDKTIEELQKSLNERAPLKTQGEQRAAEMAGGAELKPVSRFPGQFEAGSAAHRETQELCKQLEQELAELREDRNQLDTQCTKEREASSRSGKRVKELEERLARQAAELKRAKDDLANQGREQETLESNLREQLDTATAAVKQAEHEEREERHEEQHDEQLSQSLPHELHAWFLPLRPHARGRPTANQPRCQTLDRALRGTRCPRHPTRTSCRRASRCISKSQ
jgi:chromosome segregation ATPase